MRPSSPFSPSFPLVHIEVRRPKNWTLWIDLLFVHPVLVKSPAGSPESHLGMISDRRLLAYFNATAQSSSNATPPLPPIHPSSSFLRYVTNPLSSLPLPSMNLYFEVVAVHSSNTVLDAMRMMSDLGVSSVAVLEEEGGSLLSAISVTDIGQVGSDHSSTLSLVLDNEFMRPDGRTFTKQSNLDNAHPATCITNQGTSVFPSHSHS
jgi:CBS domain